MEINLNFGSIKDSVKKLIVYEKLNEGTSNTSTIFFDKIKSEPILYKQYIIYKNFEQCAPFSKSILAERFIQQNLKILEGIKWNDIVKINKAIRKNLLEESYIGSASDEINSLHNSISILIESKTTPIYKDVEKEQTAYECVVNYLTRTGLKESEEKKEYPDFNLDLISKVAVNNFNKRYSHLNEEEKSIFKVLISEGDTKKNYLKDIKDENITLINSLLSEEKNKNKINLLNEFKQKIYKITDFSNDDSFFALIELKEAIESI